MIQGYSDLGGQGFISSFDVSDLGSSIDPDPDHSEGMYLSTALFTYTNL